MNTTNYKYESDWRPYVFPKQKSQFTSDEDIKNKYEQVTLNNQPIKAGGIPIISDGYNTYVDKETVMSLIYGITGSKKSRTLIAPTIAINAKAGESMIIPDIKGELSSGELSSKIIGILKAENYNILYLDFRGLMADGFNILKIPYELYKEGKKDEASKLVSDLAKSLGSFYDDSNADPFWQETARPALESIIIMLFEICDDLNCINMHTIKTFTTEEACEYLTAIENTIESDHLALTKLRAILSEPSKTRASTLATLNTFIEPFLSNEKLSKMLSFSTFSIEELYEKKTALFIILPDEVNTYNKICGLILQQINATLIFKAYELGGKLPRRVNFICDEFCNYQIPNMKSNISASRSRNIRWYLVCQSKKQLEKVYPDSSDVILANCENTFFFNSTELSLLKELSERAGITTETPDGSPKPLISVQDLQSLKKGWEYTEVYFTSRDIIYVTNLPDINQYKFLEDFNKIYKIPTKEKPEPKVYTPKHMLYDVKNKEHLFISEEDAIQQQVSISEEDAIQQQLEAKFLELFGDCIDDDEW